MYRWVEHTGELEIEIQASSRREVFQEGFEAMRELLGDAGSGPEQRREVSLNAADAAALLADWLAELAYLGETQALVPERLGTLELGESELRAEVLGRHGDPPHLVKGATYHRLALERSGDLWRATVVLDV